MKRFEILGVLVCVGASGLCLGLTATAQEGAGDSQPTEMQDLLKAATPGENHALLNDMVGSWNYTLRMWQPDSPTPVRSTGTAENEWILGERYVATHHHGQAMGLPFEGMGCTGYDNIEKRFFSAWIDTLSTGMALEYGQYDTGRKTFTFTRTFPTPSGQAMFSKSTIEILGRDRHVLTVYRGKSPDLLTKAFEITYERVGGSAPTAMKVKAGCGKCNLRVPGVSGCPLAVEFEGRNYLVTGVSRNAHDMGLCGRVKDAICEGEVKGDKFEATRFEILE